MARMNTQGLDALINEMQKMGQSTGPLAEAMCNAATNVIRRCWREAAEEHDLIDTGAMIESISTVGPPKHIGSGIMNEVTSKGKDKSGTRNAEKAFILNYGTSRIKPTHWIDEAEAKAAPEIQSELEDMLGKYIESGGAVPHVADTGDFVHHNK